MNLGNKVKINAVIRGITVTYNPETEKRETIYKVRPDFEGSNIGDEFFVRKTAIDVPAEKPVSRIANVTVGDNDRQK